MNCIIVDDDATARMIVRQFAEMNAAVSIVEEFSSAIDAIKFLNSKTVDCVFLDIHMPGFSGFDFIKTIKNPPKIVLITSDKKFALDAFEYSSVVDYLVKPLALNRFNKAVEKLQGFTLSSKEATKKDLKDDLLNNGELYVNVEKRLVKLKYSKILLIEAKGDYIKIKTEDNRYVVHSTLKKIIEKLPITLFLKIHRSYVINLTKIIDIEDNSVLIHEDIIPVSRSNKAELMKRLNLL